MKKIITATILLGVFLLIGCAKAPEIEPSCKGLITSSQLAEITGLDIDSIDEKIIPVGQWWGNPSFHSQCSAKSEEGKKLFFYSLTVYKDKKTASRSIEINSKGKEGSEVAELPYGVRNIVKFKGSDLILYYGKNVEEYPHINLEISCPYHNSAFSVDKVERLISIIESNIE